MEPVAARLLGEPNSRLSKPPKDIRYGAHGSMKIDTVAGQFYDHEAGVGGGVLVLIKHKLGCDHAGAVSWLRREGLLSGAPHQPSGGGNEGAKKWRPEYSGMLRNVDVVIIGDSDEVEKVAASLRGIAKRIRVLDLAAVWPKCPDKGDISDWLAAGGTGEKLKALVEALPDWKPAKTEPQWKRDSFTAEELQNMTFTPASFLVRDVIPAEGVTLLCSKPKFGKSWFAYDLCIGCTSDRYILGNIKPAQGNVLYLALEDSKRRLQRRMDKLLPTFGAKWPSKLTIKTEWKRLHDGGLDDIRAWHADIRAGGGNPIMVAIDVLAMVRKPVGNRQLYEADYEALAGLTKLAHELGIAIVVLHHTRKMASDDLMETVSGSYGVSGAVDTILVMANKASGSVLDIKGRDVESRELAIEFQKESCRWRILGTAAEVHVSEQRGKIIAALKGVGADGMSVPEIMAATGSWSRNATDILLFKMKEAGDVARLKRGIYALAERCGKIGKKERNGGQGIENNAETDNLSNLSDLSAVDARKINAGGGADRLADDCQKVNGPASPAPAKDTPPGDEPGLCAQCCGREGAPPILHSGAGYPPEGIWLHVECARFWRLAARALTRTPDGQRAPKMAKFSDDGHVPDALDLLAEERGQ